jgi:hypothetical protein
MYSGGELLLISYINMINRLNVEIICDKDDDNYNSNDRYLLRKIIADSIIEIEKMGGKVRIIENGLFTLVQYNEKECSISRL